MTNLAHFAFSCHMNLDCVELNDYLVHCKPLLIEVWASPGNIL